jgi:3-phenylpropionate/trans-cinnamate dioxygenase ferredoxin subunit
VAKLSELTEDLGRTVKLGDTGRECTLFLHVGRCYAVGSLCPHQNEPLDGARAEKGQIVCRRHRYRFDLKTGNCLTIGGYGLPTYPVDLCDDDVIVSTWNFEEPL